MSAPGKIAKHLIGFAFGILSNITNFFKDGFIRFVKNFPTIKVPAIGGVQSAMGAVASILGLDEKSKFIEKGQLLGKSINLVTSLPNLALLTPFGLPLLMPHLIKSFFPSAKVKEAEKQEKVGAAANSVFDELEAEFGGGDDEFTGNFDKYFKWN